MSSGIDSASFYADFGALSSLNRQVKLKDPQAIREAARQFESLFTEMMLKSMRQAKLGNELGESDASDMYQDMYDQQLAVQMSQGKGLGLADMLVRQLTRRGEIGGATAAGGGQPSTSAAAQGTALPAGARRLSISSASRLNPLGSPTRSYAAHPTRNAVRSPSEREESRSTAPHGAAAGAASSLRERIGFVQKLAPYAERAARTLGVSSDSLIAQAALESGWGRHVASGTGSGSSHNLFGIKSGNHWQGDAASATTTEYTGVTASRVAQSFRRYQSLQQGMDDYVTLLQGNGSYRAALGSGSNTAAFAGALARGGYATDPDYAHKLVATTATVRSLRTLVAAMTPSTTAPADGTGSQARLVAALKLLAGMPITDGEQSA